jgi:1,4-dihydroxy-2-naphthoate octaprenyltransferase
MQRRKSAGIGIWIQATRPQFLTISVLSVGLGTALALPHPAPISWLNFAMAIIAILLIHASTDVLNDYYDFKSGADELNKHPLTPFAGGSRTIQRRLMSPTEMLILGWTLMLLSLIPATILVLQTGPELLAIGLTGATLGVLYSMAPVALSYRGLGELVIIIDFGILPVLGCYFIQTGEISLEPAIVGLVPGFLTAAILYINQFPDHDADLACNKRTLVVKLGLSRAALWYPGWNLLAATVIVVMAVTGRVPTYGLLALLPMPLTAIAATILRRDHVGRDSLTTVIKTTIASHNLTMGLLILCFCATLLENNF